MRDSQKCSSVGTIVDSPACVFDRRVGEKTGVGELVPCSRTPPTARPIAPRHRPAPGAVPLAALTIATILTRFRPCPVWFQVSSFEFLAAVAPSTSPTIRARTASGSTAHAAITASRSGSETLVFDSLMQPVVQRASVGVSKSRFLLSSVRFGEALHSACKAGARGRKWSFSSRWPRSYRTKTALPLILRWRYVHLSVALR
jgi:hypothetical protein